MPPRSFRVGAAVEGICVPIQTARTSDAPKKRVAELEQKSNKRLEEIKAKYSGPNPPAPNAFAAQTIFRNEENILTLMVSLTGFTSNVTKFR